MKKVYILAVAMFGLAACTSQEQAKNYGGSTTLELPAGQKVVTVTWKDADLWYLTRPARKGEVPETLTFKEQSSFGFLQGTITVIEH